MVRARVHIGSLIEQELNYVNLPHLGGDVQGGLFDCARNPLLSAAALTQQGEWNGRTFGLRLVDKPAGREPILDHLNPAPPRAVPQHLVRVLHSPLHAASAGLQVHPQRQPGEAECEQCELHHRPADTHNTHHTTAQHTAPSPHRTASVERRLCAPAGLVELGVQYSTVVTGYLYLVPVGILAGPHCDWPIGNPVHDSTTDQ
eukprot:COSAG02_NODE_8403_length_2584_cov_1.654728_1_plen_202_part_00